MMKTSDKEALLEKLTGIKASKLSYYNELKEKVKQLEVSNELLSESKKVTDDLYKRLDKAVFSLQSVSQALTTTTKGVDALLQAVVRTAAELFDPTFRTLT